MAKLPRPFALPLVVFALALPSAAAGGAKQDVCHVDGGGRVRTLNVSTSAVSAHVAHGDWLPFDVYADGDGDGFGAGAASAVCETPSGSVENADDCDDSDASVHPGVADECDGVDADCDGETDEDTLDGAGLLAYASGAIYEIDLSAGTSTKLVATSVSVSANSIASDLETGETVLHAGGKLYHLDVCTGDLDLIGTTGVGNTCGTSFGPDGDLYGIDDPTDSLVLYDTATGAATTVGALGFTLRNCGMAYDCATDTLLGLNVNPSTGTGEIFSIDPSTGAGTVILTLDPSVSWGSAGLEVEPTTGAYLVSTTSGVYTIDPDTGDATLGTKSSFNNLTYADVTCAAP